MKLQITTVSSQALLAADVFQEIVRFIYLSPKCKNNHFESLHHVEVTQHLEYLLEVLQDRGRKREL